ncbi:MAG: hypothetical protein RL199_9 [Pseudomonadota bacterium]
MAKEFATPEELARAVERVEGAFQATGRTLERLARERGVRPMLRLIQSAAAEMERKVARLAPKDETFTAVQQRAILAQYRAMLLELQPRMTRVLGEASREAQVESIRAMVSTLALAELEFEGVTTPLPLTQAARMAGIIDRDRASLLRQHDVSVRTYGIDSITAAEKYLGQSFAVQRSYSETVAGLFDMVDQSRYRAERIVRTETSWAWNTAHATALDDASELIPGLFRRWVEYVSDTTGAPLDGRVANDSLVLHGQVSFQPEGATMEARSTFLVGGTGGFEMPRDNRVNAKLWGKRYAHPPNRPNDRSRIVGWKVDWPVPAYMVVNGQRTDVKKALALLTGRDADEAREDAEGIDIPEQPLASEREVDEARAGFARERERRRAEAAAKRAKPRKAAK